MAVGKFAVPASATGGGGTLTRTLRQYTAGDTWSKPSGLVMIEVVCVGGGGGGGSGARRASGVISRGGAGASGGCVAYAQIFEASLASTVTVSVGAPGSGGAAITADNTSGAAGGTGGTTSFGTHCVAPGGQGTGADGVAGGATNLSASFEPDFCFAAVLSASGRASNSSGTSGSNGSAQEFSEANTSFNANPSAGAGGGLTTANAQSPGGTGNRLISFAGTYNTAAASGTAGGGNGGNGVNNHGNRMVWSQAIRNTSATLAAGTSGGGGGSSATTAGGAGGNGGLYGAAGGGGGGSRNGFNSGSGGNGAGGLCLVLEYTI